jgi:hypothetical protein
MNILGKLWRGQYSLPKAFWGFYILGQIACFVLLAIILLISYRSHLGTLGFIFGFLIVSCYWIIAAVGVLVQRQLIFGFTDLDDSGLGRSGAECDCSVRGARRLGNRKWWGAGAHGAPDSSNGFLIDYCGLPMMSLLIARERRALRMLLNLCISGHARLC